MVWRKPTGRVRRRALRSDDGRTPTDGWAKMGTQEHDYSYDFHSSRNSQPTRTVTADALRRRPWMMQQACSSGFEFINLLDELVMCSTSHP